MRMLMTALGSYGDVHPIVGLGAALRARGHEVTVISNPHFQSVVESAGLDFLPLGAVEDYEQMAVYQDIWHPVRGPILVMKLGVAKFVRELYEVIESNYHPGETVLVAHCLDLSSRLFQEKHDAPLASVFFAPLAFRGVHLPPKTGSWWFDGPLPSSVKRLLFWLADRVLVDRTIGPQLNGLRRELGLPPVAFIMRDWFFSPQLVLGLFPEWFAPPQPDWPPNTRLTGFPLWDEAARDGLPPDVADFLAAGDPPIVLTPGSAMAHGQAFFQAAVEACERLDRRGILLTKYPEQLPAPLPDGVRHFPFVPFSQLLPRAAALVHHGGAGSCGQGLAAGVPQLVMPMAFDQFDNAERLRRLGVASILRPKRFRGPAVARALDELLNNARRQENCRRWARQCDPQAARADSCELIEALAPRSAARIVSQ